MKKRFSILVSVLMFCLLLNPTFVQANEYQRKAEEFDQTGEKYQSASEVFRKEEVEELIEQVETKKLMLDKKDFTASEGMLRASFGQYPTRKGVILVTKDKYKGLIPTGHAAIIYGRNVVVESLSQGVTTGRNDWHSTKTTCYGVTVKNTTARQDSNAADWCYEQISKPYNFNYYNMSTRAKFYCSQLVWAAFLDNYNIDLNTMAFANPSIPSNPIHPMELVWTDKTNLIYEK
ncbi:hypothetical protein DBT48_06450 [Aerococcus mictus]|uniref:Uncharacterized protein n=1 Tax=Peptoniphilus harei TaxID=54005 RepID=A0A133PR40_9FIRM|nr:MULTISPECIES: YiiX/YebB-like N1pC/P60 family cysteine hydrolase [Bacillota]HEN8954622.1 cell wall hydrolase [Streptococcus agalactiae]HEQ4075179.1 cell wall hydrolase [Streptococcus pyogenes]KXA31097.1 hypothetical protein HMPREF3229_00523 [Peptoniphilus harei]MDK8277139.1 YiiX/YebB-like N1pC/P60 family cysteine hydrolase [Peptoniphilus duerdenii]MDU5571404.1 YiiX/YebB-like N1pC/P60 family cysteine hydrolase [Peptoniphilus harei]